MAKSEKVPVYLEGGPKDGVIVTVTYGISCIKIPMPGGGVFRYRPTDRGIQDMQIYVPEVLH